MTLRYRTPTETFDVRVCREEETDETPGGRLLAELVDDHGRLVSLCDVGSGLDTTPLAGRAEVTPGDAALALLGEWNAPGCAVLLDGGWSPLVSHRCDAAGVS